MEARVAGYVLKAAPVAELVAALRTVRATAPRGTEAAATARDRGLL